MQDSKYLYELEPHELALMSQMSYRDALMYQKNAAKKLLEKLVRQPKTFKERDDFRINKVQKAIEHNSLKLEEIGVYKDFDVIIKDEKPKKTKPKKDQIIIHKNQKELNDFL